MMVATTRRPVTWIASIGLATDGPPWHQTTRDRDEVLEIEAEDVGGTSMVAGR
jgi:hypothetical protein